MAITYAPVSHSAPTTAVVTVNSNVQNLQMMAPGIAMQELNDQWAAANTWLPTGKTADGFPGSMLPFATGTGTVA